MWDRSVDDRSSCMQTTRLVLGWLVDAGAVDGEARLARHRVGDVAVERSFTLLVAPRERVQMRLRLNIAPHVRPTIRTTYSSWKLGLTQFLLLQYPSPTPF